MLPGVPIHIVHRGNNRQPCFRKDEDRRFYLFHLSRLLHGSACALHAYCLMTNHVHLLLSAERPQGCAGLMKRIAQLHTQYINRTYGRTGSLWEGRFRSCLVQTERYVLACYRYIEANAVRAGLCAHPAEYPWSSYRANAYGELDRLVTAHDEYLRLAMEPEERRSLYRALFAETLTDAMLKEIRAATNGNFVLGGREFQSEIQARLGRRVTRGKAGRPSRAKQLAQLDLV